MHKSFSVSEVKNILKTHIDSTLRIFFKGGNVFVVELEYEIEEETYDEDGRWYCIIIEAVSGEHPKFHKLFKPNGGMDIYEDDIEIIKDYRTDKVLYINSLTQG
ncbi:MAG: hypothetical protein V3T17_03510 [Pseudomonadales bacterium]